MPKTTNKEIGRLNVEPIQRVRLVDDVTAHLRDMILTGELAPGTQLLQIELSEKLGVSRTPLREAFRVLEHDGLIRVSNGNKTVEVVALSPDDVLEIYELREVVDGLAARLLAQRRLNRDEERALRRDLTAMEAATPSCDLGRYATAHSHFHSMICDRCGNGSVRELVPLVRRSSQMTVARQLSASAADNGVLGEEAAHMIRVALEGGNEDHRAIFEAVMSGDGKEAERQARHHIRRSMRRIEQLRDTTVRLNQGQPA
jgi:GntR family transcriptional regulator of vanillate catabolism